MSAKDAKTKSKSEGKSKMLKNLEAFFEVDGKSVKTGKYKGYLLTRFDKPIKLADFMSESPDFVKWVFEFLDAEHSGACGECDEEYTTVIMSDFEKFRFEPDCHAICYCDKHVPKKYKTFDEHNGKKYVLDTRIYYLFGTMLNECGTVYLFVSDARGYINVFDTDVDEEHSPLGVLWKFSDIGHDLPAQKTLKDVHDAIEENL